jgi:hypothetical protein
MRIGRRRVVWVAAGLLGLAAVAFSQRFGGGRGGFRGFGGGFSSEAPESEFPANAEFHFLRVEYNDNRGGGFGGGFRSVSRRGRASGWWAQDWPDAEEHFTKGVQRLTRMDAGDPQHVSLTDPKLFDYPWIYATQTGYWDLSDKETAQLREYLLRGGFIMTDDFWQEQEYEVFQETMNRVLPGQPITDIGLDDSVMHVLYDIQKKDLTFIPGSRHLGRDGQIYQPPGTMPAWQAMYDPKNRMVVAVNYNTDIGDAWEFADVPYYPEAMTTLAYHYGINYLMYAITH